MRIVFQITPGTEAPAEMNFYFPERRALCMAENATHNLHNLLTLRGALVRDPRIWSRYLDEAIDLFADDTDVAFASHHWPTWGTRRTSSRTSTEQRDLYAYLHDQTLRHDQPGLHRHRDRRGLAELPPALDEAWHTRGYYGSVSHNVKAIYQRYLGWFDGNPAHLWQHPPEAAAARYVESIGGVDAVVEQGRRRSPTTATCASPPSCSTTPCSPTRTTTAAKAALADVYETARLRRRERHVAQLLPGRGHRAAQRASSRRRSTAARGMVGGADRRAALRLASPSASTVPVRAEDAFVIDWVFTDTGQHVPHQAVQRRADPDTEPADRGDADLTLTLTKPQLLGLLGGAGLDGIAARRRPRRAADACSASSTNPIRRSRSSRPDRRSSERGQRPHPVVQRLPSDCGIRSEDLEFVRYAGVQVQLASHPGLAEPFGVVEVLVAEDVELARPRCRSGQAGGFCDPGRGCGRSRRLVRRPRRRAARPSR